MPSGPCQRPPFRQVVILPPPAPTPTLGEKIRDLINHILKPIDEELLEPLTKRIPKYTHEDLQFDHEYLEEAFGSEAKEMQVSG